MTDREIYAAVFAATINGYMACNARVTLFIEGKGNVTITQYADAAAKHAVENAPKDETDIDDFPDHDMPAVMTKAYGLKIETADENKKEQGE